MDYFFSRLWISSTSLKIGAELLKVEWNTHKGIMTKILTTLVLTMCHILLMSAGRGTDTWAFYVLGRKTAGDWGRWCNYVCKLLV